MVNSIIEAISLALNAEFGDKYKVYDEEVRQQLVEPCFFVSCINPTNDLFLGRRYFRTHGFAIQYFPENQQQPKRECNKVAERLYMCLEYITVDEDLTMGTKMRYEIVDGILNFFVNYDMFMVKPYTETEMETLTVETTEKGGT